MRWMSESLKVSGLIFIYLTTNAMTPEQAVAQERARLREEVVELLKNVPPYPHEGAHGQAISLAAQRGYQDALADVLALLRP